MRRESPGPLRMLAPIGLVAFALVFVVLVFSSLGGDDSGGSEIGEPDGGSAAPTAEEKSGKGKRGYTVEPGDTLDAIAEKTGVPVEEIEALNPDVDPQALIAGSRLTLRSKSGAEDSGTVTDPESGAVTESPPQ